MSVPLLLGIVADQAAPPAAAPLHRRVPCVGGIHALVLDIEPPAVASDEAEVFGWAVAQNAILSAYAVLHDVLPVALGSAFSCDAALAANLGEQAGPLARKRANLAGLVEYVVALDLSGSSVTLAEQAAGGSEYLRVRRAARDVRRTLSDERRAFLDRLTQAVALDAARMTPPKASGRGTLSTFSALLPRDAMPSAKDALKRLAPEAERLGLALRLVGPCAPFSFVDGAACDA